MKAILGIDSQEHYKPAMCLLSRLGFPKPELTLLHSADPLLPFAPTLAADAGLQAEYTRTVENLGIDALDKAMDDACAHHFRAKTRLAYGSPSQALIHEAEQTNADLVAVCATHRGRWTSSFLGSVSRALAISCPCSILIAKSPEVPKPPMRAVFATDHSPYSDRAFERFLEMAPAGIKKITVVSAYEIDDHEAEVLHRNLAMLGGLVDTWVEDTLTEKNNALVKQLEKAGYEADARVVKGAPNPTIRRAMQEAQADLLIMGAQGHGFLERMLIGSVALHQVVAEDYPVLVLRA